MKLFCNIDASAFAAVMFVLIVIMVFSPVSSSHHGFGTDLPRVSHAVAMSGANREDAMVIGVMRDGAVYFGREKVQFDQLPAKILDRLRDRSVERRVYIRADRRAFYSNVEEVLDGVRSAGVERVAFIVDQRVPITRGP